jgi:hypothetical protein
MCLVSEFDLRSGFYASRKFHVSYGFNLLANLCFSISVISVDICVVSFVYICVICIVVICASFVIGHCAVRPPSHVPVFDRPGAERTGDSTIWTFKISDSNRPVN